MNMEPKRLRNFLLNQRVFVHQNAQGYQLGIYGIVRRLRRCDSLAWIELKVRSTNPNAHPFPEGDHRANHVLAAPEDCEQSMLGPAEC